MFKKGSSRSYKTMSKQWRKVETQSDSRENSFLIGPSKKPLQIDKLNQTDLDRLNGLLEDYVIKKLHRDSIIQEIEQLIKNSDVLLNDAYTIFIHILSLSANESYGIPIEELRQAAHNLYNLLFSNFKKETLGKFLLIDIKATLKAIFKQTDNFNQVLLDLIKAAHQAEWAMLEEILPLFIVIDEDGSNILNLCCQQGSSKKLLQLRKFVDYFYAEQIIDQSILRKMILRIPDNFVSALFSITHHGNDLMMSTFLTWINDLHRENVLTDCDVLHYYSCFNSGGFSPLQSSLQNKGKVAEIYIRDFFEKAKINPEFYDLFVNQLLEITNNSRFNCYDSAADCKNLDNFVLLLKYTDLLIEANADKNQLTSKLKESLFLPNEFNSNIFHHLSYAKNIEGLVKFVEFIYKHYPLKEGATMICELLDSPDINNRLPQSNNLKVQSILESFYQQANLILNRWKVPGIQY